MTTEERLEKLENGLAAMKEEMRTRRVVIVDQDGKPCALLAAFKDGSRLTLADKNGKSRAELPADKGGLAERGDREANQAVRKALRQILPKLEFSGVPFGDVIQFLRDVSNLNIHVKWEALRAANIDKNTPVNVKLANVTVEKTLRTVLDDVGGLRALGFVVDKGVITISTKDDLSR